MNPIQVIQAASRPAAPLQTAASSTLLIAGATGTLGNEVVRRLVGVQGHASTLVLAREPMTAGLRGVRAVQVAPGDIADWPLLAADTGVIMFDPPRLYHDRERALWTPEPQQLPALAGWMRRSGVTTLVIVLPHAQGRLPDALKRGLASLDEQAVAALGFERMLLLRTAQKPAKSASAGWLHGVAAWMLSVTSFMVPSRDQPVRAVKVAEMVGEALRVLPPGIHVAAPELVWQAAQGPVRQVVHDWLLSRTAHSTAESRS